MIALPKMLAYRPVLISALQTILLFIGFEKHLVIEQFSFSPVFIGYHLGISLTDRTKLCWPCISAIACSDI